MTSPKRLSQLARVRLLTGHSQGSLAKAAGVSSRTIAYLETRARDPKFSTALAISRALGYEDLRVCFPDLCFPADKAQEQYDALQAEVAHPDQRVHDALKAVEDSISHLRSLLSGAPATVPDALPRPANSGSCPGQADSPRHPDKPC